MDPTQPEAPIPAEAQEVDVTEVKRMVDLPETASDVELITVLVNLIANLQEKYEGVLQDAVAMEDSLTNRTIEEYSDVIDEASAPFWREQILSNRDQAVGALDALRSRVEQPEAAPAAPRMIPLRNRLAAVERTVSTVAAPAEQPAARDTVAIRIRNRAAELSKSEKIPFIMAFARAEAEITKE